MLRNLFTDEHSPTKNDGGVLKRARESKKRDTNPNCSFIQIVAMVTTGPNLISSNLEMNRNRLCRRAKIR
jgi:hypothetical protein